MGLSSRTFFVAILFLGVCSTWGTSEEDSSPAKISKDMFPKKYKPMALNKYRVSPTEEPTTTELPDTEISTTATETTSENPEAEPKLEDLTASEETFLEAMARTRKSATTTFCVEIRPSNPYQKPFQVCEPATPQYGYGYKQPRPQPRPMYQPPSYEEQPSYGSPPSYGGQPQPAQYGGHPQQAQYGGHPQQAQYGGHPQKAQYGGHPQQPQYEAPPIYGGEPQPQPSGEGYERPVMVLPHVPVAEPYHVSKPSYKPSHGGGYRSSGGGWGIDDVEIDLESNPSGRSAYYNPYDSYGEDKTTLFDIHKKKELSYIPIMTHTIKKSKPLNVLKVLLDLKKDKYKLGYDDDYYKPSYYRPQYEHHESGYEHHEEGYGQHEGGYEHHEGGYEHPKEGGSSHGLVITCQPSAVGYTGQQNQAELSKHMNLLKNIYSQSEKLYNQQALSPSYGSEGSAGEMGGGYVAPATYRSSGGEWKGAKGEDMVEESMRKSGWDKAQAEANMRKSGWDKAQAEGNMRKSGWDKAQAEENMRKAGWDKAEAEENMRKSGWDKAQAEENMRKSGWDKAQAEANMRSGGWDKAEAEGNMRKSGGWNQAGVNPIPRSHSSGGGKYQPTQMEEQVGMSPSASAGPNPTLALMQQREIEATATAFKGAQGPTYG